MHLPSDKAGRQHGQQNKKLNQIFPSEMFGRHTPAFQDEHLLLLLLLLLLLFSAI